MKAGEEFSVKAATFCLPNTRVRLVPPPTQSKLALRKLVLDQASLDFAKEMKAVAGQLNATWISPCNTRVRSASNVYH